MQGLETSAFFPKRRTKMYYAHAYCAWERGTNENSNKLIRRFIPKGADIQKFSVAFVVKIENWMNSYPRKILGFYTPKELFDQELLTA